MKAKIMTIEQARVLLAGSPERKEYLINTVNSMIEEQCKNGHRWSHLPQFLSVEEETWLNNELELVGGFEIHKSNPVVRW